MPDEVKMIGVGAYLYGAIYLVGCLATALVGGHHVAAILSVASAGASYMAQLSFLYLPRASAGIWAATIILSVAAGAALILGV